jgi:hypothetical protein
MVQLDAMLKFTYSIEIRFKPLFKTDQKPVNKMWIELQKSLRNLKAHTHEMVAKVRTK